MCVCVCGGGGGGGINISWKHTLITVEIQLIFVEKIFLKISPKIKTILQMLFSCHAVIYINSNSAV